jgi:hypothetical protein
MFFLSFLFDFSIFTSHFGKNPAILHRILQISDAGFLQGRVFAGFSPVLQPCKNLESANPVRNPAKPILPGSKKIVNIYPMVNFMQKKGKVGI